MTMKNPKNDLSSTDKFNRLKKERKMGRHSQIGSQSKYKSSREQTHINSNLPFNDFIETIKESSDHAP